MCFNETKEKSKKEDRCDSRNTVPILEHKGQSTWRILHPHWGSCLCLDFVRENSSREEMCLILPNHIPCRKDDKLSFSCCFYCAKFCIQLRALSFSCPTTSLPPYSALSHKPEGCLAGDSAR